MKDSDGAPVVSQRWVRDLTKDDMQELTTEELLALKLTAGNKARGSLDDKMKCEERHKLSLALKERIQRYNDADKEMEEEWSEKIGNLEGELEVQQKDNADIQAGITRAITARKEIEEASQKHVEDGQKLNTQEKEHLKEAAKLATEIEDLISDVAKATNTMNVVKDEVKQVSEQATQVEAENAELQEYQTSLLGFNQNLQEKYSEANTALESAQTELRELKSDVATSETERDGMNGVLSTNEARTPFPFDDSV
jgi:chromosome segregation ATPase